MTTPDEIDARLDPRVRTFLPDQPDDVIFSKV
jgi:hypothetical protein